MPDYELNNRECKEVHKKITTHKFAFPFNHPVDPVFHGLPDYFERVKHPMDLGSVRSNLQRAVYSNGSAFVGDVKLVFANAMSYNPPGSDVHMMANTLLEEFERLIKPFVKRTPAKASLPPAGAQPEEEVIPELTGRQISQLLNAVKRVDEAVWYFNEPVDPERMSIPDYFARVLNPMDLGTIKHRLDKGMYEDTASFVADVRLVWTNALGYNPVGHAVANAALKLQDSFERDLRKACSGNGPAANKAVSGAAPKLGISTALAQQAVSDATPGASTDMITALCKPIVASLRTHTAAKWFEAPVDPKKYPTYRDTIAKPMDLKTVMRNLDQQRYASIDECHVDVDLIYSNCVAFNGEGAWISNHATTLKSIADSKFEVARYRLSSGGMLSPKPSAGFKRKLGSSTPRAELETSNELCCVTGEMRSQLSANSGRLDASQLHSLMSVVKQCAPGAVMATSAQSWEIDVDLLGLQGFVKVDTWVRRLLVNKPVAC
mmetsp:Transcript_33245/g.82792  ORF Transcript_33245/g.82792 Transcript_33245/m.82792 type:complete len:491 (+) Transcript_33245:126-1598(+)